MIVAITGASSGIGRAVGLALRRRGDTVYDLSRHGGEDFFHIPCDVTDRVQVFAAIRQIEREQGRLDAFVSNAGSGISGPVEETPAEDVRFQFNVNFFGALNGAQAALPMLRESHGTLLFIGSLAGELPIPFQSFYSASKAAVGSMACALRAEVKPFGVRVGALLPGDVKTGFTGNRRKIKDSALYGARMTKAVQSMEKDEQSGMDPQRIGEKAARLLHAGHMPLYSTVGLQYKLFLFLRRLMPGDLLCWALGKLYGG